MKRLAYSLLENPICFEENVVNVLVLENPENFRNFTLEIIKLYVEDESRVFFSENYEKAKFHDQVEIILNVYEYDFNTKSILNKIYKDLEKIAYDEDLYVNTNEVLNSLEKYLQELFLKIDYPIKAEEISIQSILKGIKPHFDVSEETFFEKIVTYIEIVNKILKKEIFIFNNLKTILTENELLKLYEFCNYNKIFLLLCENTYREKLESENYYLIDKDMCQIL